MALHAFYSIVERMDDFETVIAVVDMYLTIDSASHRSRLGNGSIAINRRKMRSAVDGDDCPNGAEALYVVSGNP